MVERAYAALDADADLALVGGRERPVRLEVGRVLGKLLGGDLKLADALAVVGDLNHDRRGREPERVRGKGGLLPYSERNSLPLVQTALGEASVTKSPFPA